MPATNNDVRNPVPAHNRACPELIDILSRVGDKWTLMVIGTLSEGSMRYAAIHRSVDGISQRMLTLTLKGLVERGLVARTVHPTTPPEVAYRLTELGVSLLPPLLGLYAWALENRSAIDAARAIYALKTEVLRHESGLARGAGYSS